MSIALEMRMAPRLGLEVSPAMVVFGELLMLPYPAMQFLIDDELSANAALERTDTEECPLCRGAWRARCPVCTVRADRAGGPSMAEARDVAVAEPDTHALLRAVRAEIGTSDAAVVEYVIGSLDEHGLLDQSCAQLAVELGVAEPLVARAVDVIRRTGPPGVGAFTVAECLLLQLDALCLQDELVPLARAVINDHLPALAKGRFAAIATALGVSRGSIRQVLELIRLRLRPYPAFDGNSAATASHVVPDMIVRAHDEIDGEVVVELVEPAMNRLAIRRCGRGDGTASRAHSFLAQLHDRWATLRGVAECAVEHQKEFLLYGGAALAPLTRASVAGELGLHESTVSRAVADKYVLLPDRTVVPLSRFFGVSGGLDEELRRLLVSAAGPVSDQHLTELLREAGYSVARRTVAKHRARLGFAAASLR
ncbi:RNA polymerase, sigma 54 subunit, RpoN/SigL [Lentzea waywayandensis]|uniref:RNA polymerase, sigma 54 subunit, RpoN/SigL n=1 Tax=Lentzea waywayandensis TaxID=84724 RepID=A0A1I6FIS2_9PSEU|nr:hypothetical protein [Lentzea waywayandensis]SFR29839.1 RNA polymerase, sigma 54 subunit, RpoN/SigL [Lentzea waywayandensis]